MLTRLETLRKDVNLTQAALAKEAGVARSTVIEIENGHPSTPATLTALAEALKANGIQRLQSARLTDVQIFLDPELGPKAHRLGKLLRWLPFDYPEDKIWEVLKPQGMHSGGYLLDRLKRLSDLLITYDSRRDVLDVGEETRYVLLFLPRTQAVIAGLTELFAVDSEEIARCWYDDVIASAWAVWAATQKRPPR